MKRLALVNTGRLQRRLSWVRCNYTQAFSTLLQCSACKSAGRMFIVVLVSETLGWVPSKAQLIEAGVDITKYPVGTSLFEILIAEGTFFADNTNGNCMLGTSQNLVWFSPFLALFMYRDSGFLGGLPRELLSNYRDFSASVTLQKMKSKIHQNFEVSQQIMSSNVIFLNRTRYSHTRGYLVMSTARLISAGLYWVPNLESLTPGPAMNILPALASICIAIMSECLRIITCLLPHAWPSSL